jgi:hypothetical protein
MPCETHAATMSAQRIHGHAGLLCHQPEYAIHRGLPAHRPHDIADHDLRHAHVAQFAFDVFPKLAVANCARNRSKSSGAWKIVSRAFPRTVT